MQFIEESKKSKHLLKLLFSTILLISLFVVFQIAFKQRGFTAAYSESDPQDTRPARFYEEATFTDAIKKAEISTKAYPRKMIAGVVPHHLLASILIADLFKNLAKQKPTTIILIGPNHYELGNHKIISSQKIWGTPYGTVKPDQKIIDSLLKNGTVAIDEKVMDGEHSMGGIVPFIKYYLPDAQVVPLIVSGKLNKEEIERLVGILDTYISDKTVLVASVDFSHYQTQAKAEQNDETTLQLMKERDLDQILTLSSAYIDSPPSIAVLLSLMMRRNIEKFELVYHTNAGQILGNPHKEVTSYFSFVF